MNRKDKDRLLNLYDLIDKVPFAQDGGGSATAAIKGLADYSSDMRQFIPAFKQVLYSLACEGRENLVEGLDYEPANDMIEALTAWIQERETKNWERPIGYFDYFYREWKSKKEAKEV